MEQIEQTESGSPRPASGPWVVEAAGYGGTMLTPAGFLMLARVWHGQGAAHSAGDMLGVLGLASLLAGAGLATSQDTAVASTLVVAAATVASTGVAAYANELAYPGILAGTAALVGTLAWHRGRVERRERREQRRHERDLARTAAAATVAAAQIAADEGARYRQALADAYAHRARLDTAGAVQLGGSHDVDAEYAALLREHHAAGRPQAGEQA